ncbi:MAG: hypothetical protein QW356_06340 [Candidatus Hadarchaeales archaeon]
MEKSKSDVCESHHHRKPLQKKTEKTVVEVPIHQICEPAVNVIQVVQLQKPAKRVERFRYLP